MFVILKIIRTDKKKIRKGRTVGGVRIVNMGAGQCFYEIDVMSGANGVNWDEISAFVGKHGKNVLTDRSVVIPENVPVRRFDSTHFSNILLFNSLKPVFRELFYMGNRVRCIVNDPDGKYARNLRTIVPYAARITVVTENEFRYFTEIRDIYSDCGAGITLTDSIEDYDENTVILDTSGTLRNEKCVLFSPTSGFSPGRTDGFDDILGFCPSYVSQTDFLGAVYNFNSQEILKDAFCRTLLYGNRKFTLFETAKYIDAMREKSDRNKSIIFYV